jgi:nitric oxide reductase NorD protein
MSEPEELILEGAHFATRVARDAWRRYGGHATSRDVRLSSVRQRLELFLTALFQLPIAIAPMEPPAPRTWLSRLANRHLAESHDDSLMSGTDGRRVYLPRSLELEHRENHVWQRPARQRGTSRTIEEAIALYRLLAVQQAARLVRGTASAAAQIQAPETRDWFLLAEAAAIDRWIVREVPGLGGALKAARVDVLARWKAVRAPHAREHVLEHHMRAMLAADPLARGLGADERTSVEESLVWAQEATKHSRFPGPYRPVAPVWYWGSVLEPSSSIPLSRGDSADERASSRSQRKRVAEMPRRPRLREATEDEDDHGSGTWIIRADEPQESVEDPFGLQRPADHDEHADPEGLADSLSELPEARIVRTQEQTREVLRSEEELPREGRAREGVVRRPGISYPEWDYRTGRYCESAVVVREPTARLGDPAWVTSAWVRHARLTRRVRFRFERLRSRPVSLARQLDGSEIDLAAYVEAAADIRAGAAIDGRMYMTVRPARRELAVALLVDTSASTDAWVSADRRIVDVEKEALLVVCEALDALGDRFGVFAFAGESAGDVSVLRLKGFDERVSAAVRRRIAAQDSDRYTRLGAPVRHLTASLCREPAHRRLLLVLSDGKPNDVDLYEGRYGVEDTRQAVAEARRQGVAVFCLTVDREAPRYAARIFGNAGFAVLQRAEQLPCVLIDVLRHLIRR